MCEQCVAEVMNFGKISNNIILVRATKDGHTMKKGNWGLVNMNDPFLIFKHTPKSSLEDEDLTDSEEEFLEINTDLCFINGYTREIIEEFYKSERSSFALWLHDKIAKYIKNFDFSNVEFYDMKSSVVGKQLGKS